MYKVLTAGMGLQKERGFFEKALDGINQLTRHRDILVNLNMPGQVSISAFVSCVSIFAFLDVAL